MMNLHAKNQENRWSRFGEKVDTIIITTITNDRDFIGPGIRRSKNGKFNKNKK